MTAPSVLLKAWGLRPRKSMGQNFLADPSVAAAIVDRSGIGADDTVVEIGAGLGALTIPLARAARKVYAIEPDGRIARLLRAELLSAGVSNATVVEQDILDSELQGMRPENGGLLKVAGNLPYHISSQVLSYLVERRALLSGAVLMLQKELAERLLAKPGSKSYGRITVLASYSATLRRVLPVKATVFYPRPKVDSMVIAIDFIHPPPVQAQDETFFFRVVRAAFGKRRKMLKNALFSSDLGLDDQRLSHAFHLAAIDPVRRAETLTVEEFVRLSDLLKGP